MGDPPGPSAVSPPLGSPSSAKSSFDHEHETLDTHHELPSISRPHPRSSSRPTGQRPIPLTPAPSRSSPSPQIAKRNITNPSPKPPQSGPIDSSSPPDPSNPDFAPLRLTDSRISTRTFIEPAGLISGYPDLARVPTKTSFTGLGYTVSKKISIEPDGESKSVEVATQITPDGTEITFPDGGLQAWVVIAGGGCCLFCGFGLAVAAGSFQTYYQQTLLREYSPSTIAWIGSCQAAVAFGLAAFTGSLFDLYGHRPLVATGTVCVVLGYCMLSLCSKFYQIFLCHATLIPIGMNLMFITPVGVASQWFAIRRGFAFGIMMSGAALGGTTWPIIWSNLPQKLGFGWAMRLIALIAGILGTTGFFCMKTRLPPRPPGPFFHFEAMMDIPYLCVVCATFTYVFAYFDWLFFVGTYGELEQLSIAPWLLIILNSSSCIGRLSTSFVADRCGAYNLTIASCTVMALTFWAWLGCKTSTSLIVLNVFMGYFSGTFVSLQAPMVVRLTPDVRLSGTYIGQVLLFQSFAQLFGPPISGALLGHGSRTQQLHRFAGCIVLGATMQTMCVVFLIIARLKINRKLKAIL